MAELNEDQALSLFSRMSQGLRWVVALVASVGVLSLVLAVVTSLVPSRATVAEAATSGAMILVPSTAVILLVILYGHGTGCPSCGYWWTRSMVGTEFVDRGVFDKGGVPFARSTYRTTYECQSCRHRWSAIFTDEYKEFIQDRPKRRVG